MSIMTNLENSLRFIQIRPSASCDGLRRAREVHSVRYDTTHERDTDAVLPL